jgi:hypothetical protein
MFRALANDRRHPRTKEGFIDDKYTQYIEDQTTRFTEQIPNIFLTNAKLPPNLPREALEAINPITRSPNAGSSNLDLSLYATSYDPSLDLQDKINFCRNTSLEKLTKGPNTLQAGYRCGWVYNPNNGYSQGALGTTAGPVFAEDQGKGTWYWNLPDAKMNIEGKRCASVVQCGEIGNFPGCGYDIARGIGIPILANGQPTYPNNTQFGPMGPLIRNPATCPQPTPTQIEIQEQILSGTTAGLDTCIPGPDGKISRQCFLNKLDIAGCTPDGSLYRALATNTSPDNYIGDLTQKDSWKRYQRSATPFPEQLQSGLMNEDWATRVFRSLKDATVPTDRSGTGFAARDLCLKSGEYDKFDFCTELIDSSAAPFALECLQREFRRSGGQPAGRSYPTAANKAEDWDTLGSWRDVKAKINNLVNQAQSNDRNIQRGGLLNLLGISPESDREQIGTINGVEVLWFNQATDSFIGRRIVTDKSAGFPDFNSRGMVENTGLGNQVEFFAVTNVRPRETMQAGLRVLADDGFVYLLNSTQDNKSFDFSDGPTAFGFNRDQGPTSRTANACWTLQKNGPNYIIGYWYENAGWAVHRFEIADCSTGVNGQFRAIPPSSLFLTQEPDAPVFSWEGFKTIRGTLGFNERRFPAMMSINRTSPTGITAVNKNASNFPSPCGLQLRYGVSSCFAKTKRSISNNSWRSLSIMFIPSPAAGPGLLIKFGPFSFVYNNNLGGFWWNSGTLKIPNALMQNVLVNDGKTPHYLHLCMRSDVPSLFPNRVLFAVGPVSRWRDQTINLPSGSGPNVVTYTTANNMPVYTDENGAEKLTLGDEPIDGLSPGNLSANALIGFVRLFDYELSQEDIMRDVNNTWDMKFLTQ